MTEYESGRAEVFASCRGTAGPKAPPRPPDRKAPPPVKEPPDRPTKLPPDHPPEEPREPPPQTVDGPSA